MAFYATLENYRNENRVGPYNYFSRNFSYDERRSAFESDDLMCANFLSIIIGLGMLHFSRQTLTIRATLRNDWII